MTYPLRLGSPLSPLSSQAVSCCAGLERGITSSLALRRCTRWTKHRGTQCSAASSTWPRGHDTNESPHILSSLAIVWFARHCHRNRVRDQSHRSSSHSSYSLECLRASNLYALCWLNVSTALPWVASTWNIGNGHLWASVWSISVCAYRPPSAQWWCTHLHSQWGKAASRCLTGTLCFHDQRILQELRVMMCLLKILISLSTRLASTKS